MTKLTREQIINGFTADRVYPPNDSGTDLVIESSPRTLSYKGGDSYKDVGFKDSIMHVDPERAPDNFNDLKKYAVEMVKDPKISGLEFKSKTSLEAYNKFESAVKHKHRHAPILTAEEEKHIFEIPTINLKAAGEPRFVKITEKEAKQLDTLSRASDDAASAHSEAQFDSLKNSTLSNEEKNAIYKMVNLSKFEHDQQKAGKTPDLTGNPHHGLSADFKMDNQKAR